MTRRTPGIAPGHDRLIEAGRRICLLRSALGITQTRLSAMAAIPQTNLSLMERGGRNNSAGLSRATTDAGQCLVRRVLLETCRDRMALGIPKRPPPPPDPPILRRAWRHMLTAAQVAYLITTGARLKALRTRLDITQRAVAQAISTSQTVVSAAELGGGTVSLHPDTLRRAQREIRRLLLRWLAERRRFTPAKRKVAR